MSHYEIRAEHRPGDLVRFGNHWHVVRHGSLLGLCGRMLNPVAEVRTVAAFDGLGPEERCSTCAALREHAWDRSRAAA